MKHIYLSIFILLLAVACQSPDKQEARDTSKPPVWAKEVVWYQIFVERFNNGDASNDPTPETMYAASNFIDTPDDWSVTPWTGDWYQPEEWAKETGQNFYSNLQLRRYGGDLQGVINKLEHIKALGVTALYFNPLNDAPSLHKYDVRNFHHIDVNFGSDPEGDRALIAQEDPFNPETWQWTAADKLFLQLVDKAHQLGIRVVVDYSWNHTGVEFWAWKDIVKNQEASKYKDWYSIISFDDPATETNEFEYKGWLNISSLPELKKVNTSEEHRPGHPFEGDLHPEVKKHVFDVTKRWLAPNGDVNKGIDGYRLDVADHVPMGFWRDYRTYVKSINPEAYLVGEIWWEAWPDKLMNPIPYVSGDVFDAVMHYQVYRPARYFFADGDIKYTAQQFVDSLQFQWNRLDKEYRYGMMNVAATHDTPRLLSSFENKGMYKYNAKPDADPNYVSGKPSEETYKRVQLYLVHQFTNIGAPHIWNGDELGMWGCDDPDCRKPLWWPEYEFADENRNNIQSVEPVYDPVGYNQQMHTFYTKLAHIRHENPVLKTGEIEFVKVEGDFLVYRRYDEKASVLVAFNVGETDVQLELGAVTYTNLMTNEKASGNVVLAPLSAMVLKEIK